MTLNSVVLPEPFGQMRPRIAPLLTSRSSASSATTPPKRTLRPEQERSASLIWENSFWKILARRAGDQALRTDQQDDDHQHRVEEKAVFLQRLQLFRHQQHDARGKRHAPRAAQASEEHDRHEDQRIAERETVRRDEAGQHGVSRARDSGEEIAEGEGEDF